MHGKRLRALKESIARLVPAVGRELREAEIRRQRRFAEAQLREQAALLDRVSDAIVSMDTDWMIRTWNKAAEGLWGWSAAEAIGKAFPELTGFDGSPDDAREIAEALAVSGRAECDCVHRRKDGTRRHVSGAFTVLHDEGGRPAGYVSVSRDVTERTEMDVRLAQSDRMAAMGMLAAGVAHEINAPLSALISNVEFAAQELAVLERDARQRVATFRERAQPCQECLAQMGDITDALKDSRECAERVRAILRDVRMFSRADGEERGPVDVRQVLESSARLCWNEIRHRARLVKDYADVPFVEANEARLGQVFLNLLLNATQAIREGAVEANEIRLVTRTNDRRHVLVEVRDTGCGIPDANLTRIFDPFFTTKPAGTGLGLSISQRILKSLGGQISVESQAGKGTTFRVSLCASSMAIPAEASPSA